MNQTKSEPKDFTSMTLVEFLGSEGALDPEVLQSLFPHFQVLFSLHTCTHNTGTRRYQ